MNKKDELFNGSDIDLETADRIAKEFPSLSDKDRERMFDMTMKKMNMTDNAIEENNSVHGVEKYARPKWIKFAGMAASITMIVGGIGGGAFLLHNMKVAAPDTSSEVEVVSTTAETTTAAAEENSLTPEEEAAHKLTDDYWDYECFFDVCSRTRFDPEGAEVLTFNCTMQYIEMSTDVELTYYKSDDDRLQNKTMDGLMELYNTYYSKDYDPFYSVNAEYTNNRELFGPSFTKDTLPADGKLDRAYTYIMYEGMLYQMAFNTDYVMDNHWSDDQVEISDVTDSSFTLKRKFNNTPNAMNGEIHGEVTFKIVFDDDVNDWRIQQKDVESEY